MRKESLGEPRQWRFLDTGFAEGPWNLALDEALFRLAGQGRTVPTIRFYGWSPPAISVGHFQKWEQEVDREACRIRGVGIYRRITGGRAVYHDGEITYSVVCSRSVKGFGEALLPVYRKIARGLAAGLAALGVDAQIVHPAPRGQDRGVPRSPSCFAAASGYELAVDGRKLVGSAQKRSRGAVLQHGSILLSSHNESLAAVLRSGAGASLPPTASLESVLGGRPEYREVVAALKRGFEKSWDIPLLPAPLEGEEKALAHRLARDKYGSLTEEGGVGADCVSVTSQ